MQNTNNLESFEDEITLVELFKILFAGKWTIIFYTTVASIFIVFFSLSLPNIYRSEALLTPVAAENSLGGALESLGSLGALAGNILPTEATDSNSAKAMEKVSSLSFFEEKILPQIFLPNLMAVESWSAKSNIVTYDDDIYDQETDTWTRDYSFPQTSVPSAQESHRAFLEHLDVAKDIKTGFVTFAIEHQSPFIAEKWASLVVSEINAFYRQKDKVEGEASINYLTEQVAKTGYTEIRKVVADLAQREMQKMTLIEATDHYVFDVIDPPAVMERKFAPSRAIICIIGAILGGIIGVIVVLLRHYLRS
jgi:hypothetical protein